MGFLKRLFGKNDPAQENLQQPDDKALFMEHPIGEFDTSLQAIESVMQRLDRLEMNERWITFSGQGQGSRPDSYLIGDVKFRNKTFKLQDQTVDIMAIMDSIGFNIDSVKIDTSSEGTITLPEANPEQLARFLDALFQQHFSIKPFEGENDYAVGAEWC